MFRNFRKSQKRQEPTNNGTARRAPAERPVSSIPSLVTVDVLSQTLVGTIVDGDLTADKVADLSHELKKCFSDTPDVEHMVLDLQGVDYMDSTCLNMFVDLLNTVRAAGGGIAIAGAVAHVEVLFKLTRLDQLFPIKHDVLEAVDAVRAAA